jgi:site-specific DNA recombinase
LTIPAATVVARIVGQFIGGDGLFAIAESLSRDGILCPSGYRRSRRLMVRHDH